MPQNHTARGVATAIYGDGKATHVIYHGTAVVSFDADTVTLRTGGWRTATTKLRMNQAARQFHLGYRVDQKNSAWTVTTPRGDVLPFDGSDLVFTRAGELVSA